MSTISPGVLAPPHEVLTPDEWRTRGREQRGSAPRSSHAHWVPPPDRPDPVAVLEEQAKTRVRDLIPIRYGRMAASPFAYYRGAAAPMAWDLARTPSSGIRVQACGDAHLLNFGMYAAPDRRLVFDVELRQRHLAVIIDGLRGTRPTTPLPGEPPTWHEQTERWTTR
jgi:Uncharacterized protein conserved in bacteria (DUF2252)